MYQEMREGIVSYFGGLTGHAFYTGTAGRLAYSRAPSTWETDYAVFSLENFVSASTFDATIEQGSVVFNCYADDAEGADDLAADCVSMFGRQRVTVGSNPAPLYIQAINPAVQIGENENELWNASVEFTITAQR